MPCDRQVENESWRGVNTVAEVQRLSTYLTVAAHENPSQPSEVHGSESRKRRGTYDVQYQEWTGMLLVYYYCKAMFCLLPSPPFLPLPFLPLLLQVPARGMRAQ